MKMLRNLGLMLASTFGLTLASPALAAVEICTSGFRAAPALTHPESAGRSA